MEAFRKMLSEITRKHLISIIMGVSTLLVFVISWTVLAPWCDCPGKDSAAQPQSSQSQPTQRMPSYSDTPPPADADHITKSEQEFKQSARAVVAGIPHDAIQSIGHDHSRDMQFDHAYQHAPPAGIRGELDMYHEAVKRTAKLHASGPAKLQAHMNNKLALPTSEAYADAAANKITT